MAISVFTPALAGCLLLLSWLQHRNIIALALWGAAFVTISIATTLIVVGRGTIPDFWSIIVGNALLAAAYGVLWCAARKFEGKSAPILPALLGVGLWIAACSIGPIYTQPQLRAIVIAAIAIADRRPDAFRSAKTHGECRSAVIPDAAARGAARSR